MCITPKRIWTKNGRVEVACQNCWQCSENWINDLAGRNIAESKVSIASWAITLTYGRDDNDSSDHVRAAVLTYSDVQKFFKLLRRHGYEFSYTVTGEFGGLFGRTHWHIVMHWKTEPPVRAGTTGFKSSLEWHDLLPWSTEERRVRFNWYRLDEQGKPVNTWWPWGYVEMSPMTYAAVRYNLKYITKDVERDSQRQGKLAMSTAPPLGAEFFAQLAEDHVLSGLSPQKPEYGFVDVKNKEGETQWFWLTGRSRELYLQAFIDGWRRVHGKENWPWSALLDDYQDSQAKDTGQGLEPDARYGEAPEPWRKRDREAWMRWDEIHFDPETGHYKYSGPGGLTLYYTRTIGGAPKWRNEAVTVVDPALVVGDHPGKTLPSLWRGVSRLDPAAPMPESRQEWLERRLALKGCLIIRPGQ